MKRPGKRLRKKCDRWREYERRKQALQMQGLSSAEYEDALKALTRELKV